MSRSYYDLEVGTRVLIVDDEPQLLALMERYLAHLNYTVTARDAVGDASAEPASFDIAILDMVPGAEEFARAILTRNPQVRVIATSGYPTDITELEALAPARVAFLQKPFTPEMLEETVRGMMH